MYTLSQAARKSCSFSARFSLFIAFKREIPRHKFTDKLLKAHNTVFICIDVCSPHWLRQQSTQLPPEQQKLAPSILVSRYSGSEESPHAAKWAQTGRKFHPSPNTPKGSVGLNVEVPSGVFFFCTSSPNSCDIRLGCCSQLLQRAANTVANYPANSTVNRWIARMISKHHLLSPGSATD